MSIQLNTSEIREAILMYVRAHRDELIPREFNEASNKAPEITLAWNEKMEHEKLSARVEMEIEAHYGDHPYR